MMEARLTKSRTNRVIDGVCGGLAEYFGVDPVLVRLAFVIMAAINGLGVLAYILLMILLPRSDQAAEMPAGTTRQYVDPLGTRAGSTLRRADRGALAGAILILLGVFFMLESLHLLRWLRFDLLWPVVLIVLGVLLLTGQLGRSRGRAPASVDSSLVVRETPPASPERQTEQPGAGTPGDQDPGI